MAWTNSRYDNCAYTKDLSQSTSSLNYVMDPSKFYNCSDCRVEFGLIGGNNTSITNDNMVDLESDLFNITRQTSRCPERKYLPLCAECDNKGGLPCGSAACKAKQNLRHLPSCNMIQYGPRIDHVGFELKYPGCSAQPKSASGQSEMTYPPQLNPVQWKGRPDDIIAIHKADKAQKSKSPWSAFGL